MQNRLIRSPFLRDPLLLGSAFILFLVAICTVFAPWITPYSPNQIFDEAYSLPPFFLSGSDPRFFLGTDDLGRDILTRLIFGARVSALAGLTVVFVSMSLGVFLGALAGWHGGFVEALILRIMDIMMAIPSILLAIVIVTLLGPSLINAVLAAAITAVPGIVRVVRAQIREEKAKPYALSAKLYGASHFRIVSFELLPNSVAPILVQLTMGFGDGILNVAALGFLGLGARPPMAEWGTMLSDARGFMETEPWLVTAPGICILLVILSFNLLGDSIRDRLDPKVRSKDRGGIA